MPSNYDTVPEALANLEAFDANTMRGYWGTDVDGEVYLVLSYRTVIATARRVGPAEGAQWGGLSQWITNARYSQTTARHIRMVAKAWEMPEPMLDPAEDPEGWQPDGATRITRR